MKLLVPVLVVLTGLTLLAFIIIKYAIPADTGSWECQNGQWIKIGEPSSLMPQAPCPDVTTSSNQSSLTPNDQRIGGDTDEGGCLIGAGYRWCSATQSCLRFWETPCIPDGFNQTLLTTAIKNQINAKRGPSAAELTITILEVVDGQYAQGNSRPANPDAGGGMWFAAFTDGEWHLVWDGNGSINCTDLTAYPDFPTRLIPECINTTTGEPLTR